MSNFATLPQKVGLPQELQVNEIDPCMPHDAKSNSIRVYASNNQSVLGAFATGATAVAAGVQMADIPFPQTEITFDLPCAQSRDTFIDTRLSTINFRAVVTVTTAGTTKVTQATLRSSAYAYFDSMRVTGQSGQILESINEYGLLADSLIQGQMSNSDREGLFNYGFKSNYGLSSTTAGINVFTNTGHDFKNLSGTLTTGDALSSNYSLPLLSSVIGTLNDRFFPIGLTRKLLLTLTTAPVLPFNIVIAPTTGTTPGTTSQISVLLTDFWLNLETIQIGPSAMESVLSNLHDGKMFLHGTTYKTTTALIPQNTAGQFNLPVGLTGSSVRSLFTRFSEQSATATWGKYNSGCPNLNQFGFNIGGIQVPASLYNPLLYPAQCWRSFLMAMGNFNSTQQKSGITALNYCVLSSGGTATVAALGSQSNTQDSYFATTNATPNYQYQSSFLLGENIETIPKRGLISGRDLTFQKVNLVLGLNATLTNPVNVYVTAMMDTITIVDVVSGEVVTIL